MDTKLIPQADSLPRLRDFVAFAERRGSAMPLDAGKAAGLTARHAAYYREAAECLGLVRGVGKAIQPTDAARQLLSTPPESPEEARVWRRLIEQSPILTRVAPGLLAEQAPTRNHLAAAIEEQGGLSQSVCERRADCLLRWRGQVLAGEEGKAAQLELPFA